MADYNKEVEAIMSDHKEAVWSKEYKQLILQQLVKEIDEEAAKANSFYVIIGQVIM